jgi:Fe-S cluster assembly protein SufD
MSASNSITTLPTLAELTDVRIAETARAAGEPEWLVEKRAAAWRHFAETPPPIWRRTDLTKFKADGIAASIDASNTLLHGDAAQAGKGVIFTTLAAAVRDHEALVKRYHSSIVDSLAHKFTALNAALWQDGVFLYVPKNTAVEIPLVAMYTLSGNSIFPHSLIILDHGASATFIEEYRSEGGADQALSGPTTEIYVGENASLRFISVQNWGENVYHIGAQRAQITSNGNLDWVTVNLGGRLQHVEAESSLEGHGSRIEWTGATFADGKQSLLTAPTLRHAGVNTESHLDFKTVVDDGGYSTFDGMIKIEHESRATSTRLEEHALHLSPGARSDSIPGLKIDTNDVQRAGHASTSGQVDEELLFYMRSRGIQRADAVKLIVMGFFEPALDRIPDEALRDRIIGTLESKI